MRNMNERAKDGGTDMIGNLMTVTVDQFIKGTLKRGVPGNYLAVVSSIDEEFRLRDLLWKEIQKIADDGNHVIEEIDYYQARFHKYKVCGADINKKALDFCGKMWYDISGV